jgi:hypothetical protein
VALGWKSASRNANIRLHSEDTVGAFIAPSESFIRKRVSKREAMRPQSMRISERDAKYYFIEESICGVRRVDAYLKEYEGASYEESHGFETLLNEYTYTDA